MTGKYQNMLTLRLISVLHHKQLKRLTIDLENGNNDAKLEIINDLSSAIDEIEQITKQLNSLIETC